WARRVGADAWPASGTALDGLVRRALARRGDLAGLARIDAELKQLAASRSEALLAELARLAASRGGGAARLLDWDGVRALARGGVEIGAHTVTHPILSKVSLACAERELLDAKARIEAQLDAPVHGFAYPNGRAGDFGDAHVALVRRSGYRYACTAERGANRSGADVFRLRRIGVGCDAPALLDLKLALAGGRPACAA
ncbi:MAG: polysaccharide deacetylase family protein, partial [Deltaproteobacteria bacterium]|nr:polysaccharide deacetylase family protein [Deltaproteobacteria bacterium]